MTHARSALLSALLLSAALGWAQAPAADPEPGDAKTKSHYKSPQDGAFDISGFLDETYGFLPLVTVITEPAVGYGLGAAVAFLDKPLGEARAGLGRPDITFVGGLATENGSWAGVAGDMRNWMGERIQTLAGVLASSFDLDYYGIGGDSVLNEHPLHYTLAPKGALVQAKYRLGDTRCWVGLGYGFMTTRVRFDAPDETPNLPDIESDSDVAGLTPSFTFDTRDNMFTPVRGTYVEARAGLFRAGLGGDADFERSGVVAEQFSPLAKDWFLGVRGEVAAASDDSPFYLRPYVAMRGVAAMRYQGDEMAQIEAELRWRCWKRWSVVAFGGYGSAWIETDRFEKTRSVAAGGVGFRYELARAYGILAGLDFGMREEDSAVYIVVGSAWQK
jgi:hypothetical protein